MEYYARLFLIVYVGAIVVLFLFIIRRLELKRVNVATRLSDLFSFRHLILLCVISQTLFIISTQFFDLSGFNTLSQITKSYLIESNSYMD